MRKGKDSKSKDDDVHGVEREKMKLDQHKYQEMVDEKKINNEISP